MAPARLNCRSLLTSLVLGAAGLALASAGPASAEVVLVHAGTLIDDAREAPKTQMTVRIEDGRITDVEPGYMTEPGAQLYDLTGFTVMAGLIDSHVHLTSELGPGARLAAVEKSDADFALDAVKYARRTLEAGFTTVQDVGARGDDAIYAVRDAIERGDILGPRIRTAGHTVAASGGHGDRRHGYNEDVAHTLLSSSICNGADDCRRAVREEIRRGADLIKITATGGVLSNTATGQGQQLLDDELEAIVEAAATMGRKVTAHAHGKSGIDAALRAGVRSIEHGTFLDAESIRLFKQNDAYLVPTVLAGVTVAEMAETADWMTPPQREKSRQVGPQMLAMLTRAHAGGVKIAFGTDSGVSAHGDNARELELMVEAGMTAQEALVAATINSADHMGVSDLAGRIAPTLSGDLVAVEGDPLDDISVLRAPHLVMARGKVALDRR